MELIKPIDCAEAIYEALRTPMLKGTLTDTMSLAISLVKEVPTIDAEPVKHGQWVYVRTIINGEKEYKCSECNAPLYCYGTPKQAHYDYCYSCGARMDLDEV